MMNQNELPRIDFDFAAQLYRELGSIPTDATKSLEDKAIRLIEILDILIPYQKNTTAINMVYFAHLRAREWIEAAMLAPPVQVAIPVSTTTPVPEEEVVQRAYRYEIHEYHTRCVCIARCRCMRRKGK